MLNTPLQMFMLMLAGWVNEQHRAVNAYLTVENRVLRELHGKKRLRFNDDQRRRLAVKGAERVRLDRDTRHDPALAPGADCEEI